MKKDSKVFIGCQDGMIGAALRRHLAKDGFPSLLGHDLSANDLIDQQKVFSFFNDIKPDYVFLPSVRIGGILANSQHPAEFIYENIQVQSNVIHAAWKSGVKKLLFLGSSCMYPKECPQPMKEEYLLTGALEPTSEPYAIAKIAGIRMCQSYDRQYGANFITAVPADLYGPEDDFDPATGHVFPALMSRMHKAKINGEPEVSIWGTGSPRRGPFHVDDLASACVFLMDNYDDPAMINAGSGEECSIKELALLMKNIVGFNGKIVFDTSKPDGAPRKLLDCGKIMKMGWKPRYTLEEGLRQTYRWYREQPGETKAEEKV